MPAPTNVYRLYNGLVKDEGQVGWYDPGVATETSSQAVAGATAGRIAATIGYVQASQIVGFYVKFRTIIEPALASASPRTSSRPTARSFGNIVRVTASI